MPYGLDIEYSPGPGKKRTPNAARSIALSFYFPGGGISGCRQARALLETSYGGSRYDWAASSAILTKGRLIDFVSELYANDESYRNECMERIRTLPEEGWYEVIAWEL